MEPVRTRPENARIKRYGLRYLSPRAQIRLGVAISIGIVLAAAYALFLGTSIFGHSVGIGWFVLFYGTIALCGSTTPVAVNLLRVGTARLRDADANHGESPAARPIAGPAPTINATGPEERQAERQLLEAIERLGEITPTRAALETTLTVAEADRMLSDLARAGHLEMRAEGGRLVYSLL
jgi:hypothetical protein